MTLTEPAGALLTQMLSQVEAPNDAAVRFFVEGDALSMKVDTESEGDDTFEHEGKTILLLDPQVSQLLTDKTLDVEDGEEGPRLTIK